VQYSIESFIVLGVLVTVEYSESAIPPAPAADAASLFGPLRRYAPRFSATCHSLVAAVAE